MKRCSSLRHCLAALLPKEAFLEAPDQTEEVARFNAQPEPIYRCCCDYAFDSEEIADCLTAASAAIYNAIYMRGLSNGT